MSETEEIIERYKRRETISPEKYNPLSPAVNMIEQEKERTLIKWIKFAQISPLLDKKLLEIGCGNGTNLLEFIRLGFKPANLTGNDLLKERVNEARTKLPQSVNVIEGNALSLNLEKYSFDIVFQSTVFSSILDESYRHMLAKKMWELTKTGGGVLWYDFIYNNPYNKDVQKATLKDIRKYFPEGEVKKWKITLAPPVSRIVTKINSNFYYFFNLLPLLRTHLLCWIKKLK